ncbi:MBL fold metallo-hydrolase [Rhizobium sp. L1K21]|uniref:MBL fold metallo-hydrolase n=1 Tax=Rhizobium sp. L1K21 TaxID=2954933 RepID=UPI002093000B|nr:MBL fold metallo-hydrolase [Rhizobium sp. L1K21]MCO6185075.1 MBL fold metallo-hydrolase [Rhizobium sp. L1K21]
MLRALISAFAILVCPLVGVAHTQNAPPPVSICHAIASGIHQASFVRFDLQPKEYAAIEDEVKFTYVGHSTYFIETPGGVSIATDYSGHHPTPYMPTVVTMNKAHSGHYTLAPDPGIQYVLHGWNDDGSPANHQLAVGDTLVRNVPTDIRSYSGAMEANGNSIFIFEAAGLCIGHLGHLHHELTDSHITEIGRLDIVMVPVDGGLTMGAASMSRTVKKLRSSVVLPMHRRFGTIEDFVAKFGPDFDLHPSPTRTVTFSLRNLPRKPTIYVLPGL